MWIPQHTRGVGEHTRGVYGGGQCQLLTDNIVMLQFCTKLQCASQEHCHVCLGSYLTAMCSDEQNFCYPC